MRKYITIGKTHKQQKHTYSKTILKITAATQSQGRQLRPIWEITWDTHELPSTLYGDATYSLYCQNYATIVKPHRMNDKFIKWG